MHVRHHAVARIAGEFHLAQPLARRLVHGVQLGRAVARVARVHEHVGGDDLRGLPPGPRVGDVDALERRVVEHVVGGVAHRDPPEVLAGVHVDRGDLAVGGLVHREPPHAPDARAAQHREVVDGSAGGRFHPLVDLVAGHHQPRRASLLRGHEDDAALGIHRGGAVDVGAAHVAGTPDRPQLALVVVAVQRRLEERTPVVGLQEVERGLPQLRGEVDEVVHAQALHVVRRGLGGVRLRLGQLLARHLRLRHRLLLDGPEGFAGRAVEGVGEGLLGDLHDGGDVLPVHGHVHQDRRGGGVVVPDVVMDELVVPLPLPGPHVERDQAGAEQVVAGPEAAVEVLRGAVGGDVDEPQLGVGRERRPRGDVAGPLPGVVLPGLVPELAGAGEHVELPQEFAGARVVGEDVAGDVLHARLVVALLGGVAHDDHAVDHDGRRRAGDVALLERHAHVRIVLVAQVGEQVHGPGLREALDVHRTAEAFDGLAGLGVQRVQEEGGRDHVDDVAPVHVGVGDALAVVLPHRVLPAEGLGLDPVPEHLAAGRVGGDHVALLPGDADQLAIDVDGGRARVNVRIRGSVPDPLDFELVEVGGVDLGQLGVALAAGVAPDEGPVALGDDAFAHARVRRRDARPNPEGNQGEPAPGSRGRHP